MEQAEGGSPEPLMATLTVRVHPVHQMFRDPTLSFSYFGSSPFFAIRKLHVLPLQDPFSYSKLRYRPGTKDCYGEQ